MCTYNAPTHATLARTRDNQRPTPLPLVLPDVRVAFRATIKTLFFAPSLPPPVLHSGTITKVVRGKSLCCNNDKQKRGVWEEDDV